MPNDVQTGQTAVSARGPLVDVVHAVAHNVKRLRTAQGLSQAELARQSGIAKATLSQLEVGRGNPTIETLFALSRVLRVPLGALLDEIASGAARTRAASNGEAA